MIALIVYGLQRVSRPGVCPGGVGAGLQGAPPLLYVTVESDWLGMVKERTDPAEKLSFGQPSLMEPTKVFVVLLLVLM